MDGYAQLADESDAMYAQRLLAMLKALDVGIVARLRLGTLQTPKPRPCGPKLTLGIGGYMKVICRSPSRGVVSGRMDLPLSL